MSHSIPRFVLGLSLLLFAAPGAVAWGELQFLPSTKLAIPGSFNDNELPTLTLDNLTLIFTSTSRKVGRDDSDLWQTTRPTATDAFGTPVNLSALNSSSEDLATSISHDGLSLYFVSDRPGAVGDRDIWVSTRTSTANEFGSPVNAGPGINTEYLDGGPEISQDGLTLWFNSNVETFGADRDIYMATRATTAAPFGSIVSLGSNVNSDFDDAKPSVSADGLDMVFGSNRPGGFGEWDLWMSSRDSLTSPWSPAVNLGPNINGPKDDLQPDLSWDGARLLYSSDRIAGYQVYESVIQSGSTLAGDFDFDGKLTIGDVDKLSANVRSGKNTTFFDLNQDTIVDINDLQIFVKDLRHTWFGDADFDGQFNSSDLVAVFAAGQYDDSKENNSTWATGDWNADGDFNSGDLVVAFQDGGYERNARVAPVAVPEPTGLTIALLSLCSLARRCRLHLLMW